MNSATNIVAPVVSGKFWPADGTDPFEPVIGDTWETDLVTAKRLTVSGRIASIGAREECVNGMWTEIAEIRPLAAPVKKINPWRRNSEMRRLVPGAVIHFTHVVVVRRVV